MKLTHTHTSTFLSSTISSLAAVVFLCFLAIRGQADETWKFDPTFQRTPLLISSENAYGVKRLSSGKVLSYTINGGLLSGANGQRIGALIRLDPNTGAIDPTWHPDPTVTPVGFAGVAEAPDGKIYYSTALAGEVASQTDPSMHRLIRLNADGSRDLSFNSPTFAATSRFVTVQPDGKIIVCSGGVNIQGVPQPGTILLTVRLNTDGSLDNTFQSPVFGSTATGGDLGVFANPVVEPATGKIYFCGTFRFVNGQARKGIARCNADGTLDTSFVPTGLPTTNTTLTGRGIVLQAGGKVVWGGTNLRTATGGNTRYALFRFLNDGTFDTSFTLFPTTNSSGVPLVNNYTGPRDLHATPDGKILTSDTRIIRFLADGATDFSLDYSSPYTTSAGPPASFRFDIDTNTGAAFFANPGPVYARLGGVATPGPVTKLLPNGTIDSQFVPPTSDSEDFAPKVEIAANGSVYVAGRHTDFGNTPNASIARLLADGTRDPAYSLDTLPFIDKQANSFAPLPNGSAYVSYFSGSFNGNYFFSNLVRLLPTGAVDTSFRPSTALQTAFSINAFDGNDVFKSALVEIAAAPMDKLYLFPGGPQATVNTNGNLRLTRINTDGTEDMGVAPLGFPNGEVVRDPNSNNMILGGSSGYIRRLAETADGGFIVLASVAPFPTNTGAPYNYKIVKLKADGSRDQNYNSPPITSAGSPLLDFPVIFDPLTGTSSQPFNGFYVDGALAVSSAAGLPDGSVILAGQFRINDSSTTTSVAKLTATGALDPSFSLPSPGAQNLARPGRPAVITNVRVAPDGKLWILGRFDTFGGSPAPGFARLNSDGTLVGSFHLSDVEYYDYLGDYADVVFADSNRAYLVGTYRRPGESIPFAVTRIVRPAVITSPLSASGTVGEPFTYQIVAGSSPTSFTAAPLPPGLSLNASLGIIAGTPSQAGTTSVTVTASNSGGTDSQTLVINIQPAPSPGGLHVTSGAVTARTGEAFSYQVIVTGAGSSATFSATGLPAGLTINPQTGIISGTVSQEGSFTATITVTDGSASASGTLQLTFTSDPFFPIIDSPRTAPVAPGQPFTYTITAPGGDPSDPTTFSIIGTLPDGLVFDPATGTISGIYNPHSAPGTARRSAGGSGYLTGTGAAVETIQIVAHNSHGTATTTLTFLAAPGLVGNVSTRLPVGTDENVLIEGFIVQGPAGSTKKILVRAIGPSLASFGVPDALANPTLEIHDASNGTVATNNDWKITQVGGLITGDQFAEINATQLAPGGDLESAVIADLPPGGYTAIVRGLNNTTGTGLVDAYDLSGASPARLANIATRGLIGPGDQLMIAGFIVQNAPVQTVIRAIGPSLTAFGVVNALPDTTLQLRDQNGGIVLENDDWKTTQRQELEATGLQPTDDLEAALVTTIQPGQYTAQVRGKNDATGIGMVQVYFLQ